MQAGSTPTKFLRLLCRDPLGLCVSSSRKLHSIKAEDWTLQNSEHRGLFKFYQVWEGETGNERKTLCSFPRGVGQCLQMENGGFSFATCINPDSLPLLPTPSWELLLNCSSLDMALRAVCGFQPQCFQLSLGYKLWASFKKALRHV